MKKKYKVSYKDQVFLNSKKAFGTGTAVACYGKWNKDEDAFLEISDCHNKVRLHIMGSDSRKAFINKMKKLRKLLDRYIKHLEKQ
jgi:hypothetical protein